MKTRRIRSTGVPALPGDLLLALYRGVREADGWLEFQRLLSQELRTINSVLGLRWPEGARQGLIYTFNGDTARLPPELQPYAAIDPFVNIPDARAVRLLDLVDPAAFRRTAYYREWLVPIGVEYAVGLDVREPGRFHARLRLCRARSAGNFSEQDCRLVESLAPHLRLAVSLYSDLDEAKSERALYADAMDRLTLATIVLDEDGAVVHSNRMADAILRQRDGLALSGRQLAVASRDEGRSLRELVLRAAKQYSSARPAVAQAMRVSRPSGKPALELVVRPSPPGLLDDEGRLNARVAIFIGTGIGEARTPGLPVEAVQQLFGLTPKEAALALRLAAGRSLLEAARDQRVSLNTARAHLRAIYAKTGFDRQSSLVRALLQSVAMLAQ